MKNIKPTFLFVAFLSISINSDCQTNIDSTAYKKELTYFMRFVRDSIFKSQKILIVEDNLHNKNMFGGTVLYGTKSHNGILTEAEKEEAIRQMKEDTTKYFISKTFFRSSKLIKDELTVSYPVWQLSKPIFLRDCQLCIFSFGSYLSQKTFLFKKVNGHWKKEKQIGRIANY
jgi:hypothetical protein